MLTIYNGPLPTIYMRLRYLLFAVSLLGVVTCAGQDWTNAVITNSVWNGSPELANTPSSWVYPFTPGTYFWAGFATAFVWSGIWYTCRLIRSVSEAGDVGAHD